MSPLSGIYSNTYVASVRPGTIGFAEVLRVSDMRSARADVGIGPYTFPVGKFCKNQNANQRSVCVPDASIGPYDPIGSHSSNSE